MANRCRWLCVETHDACLEENSYINMDLLKEQKKATMKVTAWSARPHAMTSICTR